MPLLIDAKPSDGYAVHVFDDSARAIGRITPGGAITLFKSGIRVNTNPKLILGRKGAFGLPPPQDFMTA